MPLLQVLGDFAGGGLHLAYGVVCALFEARRSGQGQVVDAAMVDGVASIFSVFYGMAASGMHTEEIGTNLFDGGAPFYNVYETADARYVTLAPIEPHFYAQLLDTSASADDLPAQYDREHWPEMKDRIAAVVAHQDPRRVGSPARGDRRLLRPGVPLRRGARAPAQRGAGAFVPTPDGGRQLRPSPRCRPHGGQRRAVDLLAYPGADTDAVLGEFGYDAGEIARLRAAGVVV